jgi:hypothetical protein
MVGQDIGHAIGYVGSDFTIFRIVMALGLDIGWH